MSTANCKKTVNEALVVNLLKASMVTAVGYTAWVFATQGIKQDWTKGKSYLSLFLIVAIALILANLVFTLIFQRSQLIRCPKTDTDNTEEDLLPENQPIFF